MSGKTYKEASLAPNSWSWILGPVVIGGLAGAGLAAAGLKTWAVAFFCAGSVGTAFMLYFHRNPGRVPPVEAGAIVAGADGLIRRVETLHEPKYLGCETVRISIFLSPFNVHVNRAPMEGRIERLEYTPGRHLLTIRNAASEVNEHSSIFIDGQQTRCLVRQIVGPIVRRVVYWLSLGQEIAKGEPIGMMRFGSRLDIYLPASDVEVLVRKGDKVRAGETIVARIAKRG